MLIQMDGGRKAPSIVSDEELSAAFQGRFGLDAVAAADFMRGYQTLAGNPHVKHPMAIEDEHGKPCWMFVLTDDTIDTVVDRWIRTVPVVAQQFSDAVKEYKATLYHENGMSEAKLSRLKILCPLSLYYSLKALDESFWDLPEALKRLVEHYPLLGGAA